MDDIRDAEPPGGHCGTSRPPRTPDAGYDDVYLIDHLLDLAPAERVRFVARLRETDRPLADRAERHAHVMGVFETLDAGANASRGPAPQGPDSPTVQFARMVEGRAEGVVAEFVAGSPFEPGDTLGPYRVVRGLGRGGMGVVYLARRDDLGLQVALKLLSEPFAVTRTSISGDDPARTPAPSGEAERFYAEPRALARLDHPGVPQVHDAGWTDDGDRSSSWSSPRAVRSRSTPGSGRSGSRAASTSSCSSARPSSTPTGEGSPTATSSRRTCSSETAIRALGRRTSASSRQTRRLRGRVAAPKGWIRERRGSGRSTAHAGVCGSGTDGRRAPVGPLRRVRARLAPR